MPLLVPEPDAVMGYLLLMLVHLSAASWMCRAISSSLRPPLIAARPPKMKWGTERTPASADRTASCSTRLCWMGSRAIACASACSNP